jgi:hypothetical protein
VEVARAENEFQRKHHKQGGEVEGWHVREYCVGFDAFKCQDRAPVLDLRGGVGGDLAEGRAEHGDEDGEEERVAQEGEGDE